MKKYPKYGIRLTLPSLPGFDWEGRGSYSHKIRLASPPQVGDPIIVDDSLTRLVVVEILHWACLADVNKKIGKGKPDVEIQCELYMPESCDPKKLKEMLTLYEWN